MPVADRPIASADNPASRREHDEYCPIGCEHRATEVRPDADRPTIPAIRVTRELYDSDRPRRRWAGRSSRNRMAFRISFPDGTGCWSHNTANAGARIKEYRAAARRPVDVDWRISDISCPVLVDGMAAWMAT